jgi:hypothetical protein
MSMIDKEFNSSAAHEKKKRDAKCKKVTIDASFLSIDGDLNLDY